MKDDRQEMSAEPLISIIVATYKAEGTIDRFFESVVPQAENCGEGVEIIIVDDASPDRSREIALDWKKRHGCIKVVSHDVNKGAAAARNTGIDSSCGEYMMMVDPDDTLRSDALARLVPIMRGSRPDMIRWRFRRVDGEGKFVCNSPPLHGDGLYTISESASSLRIGFLDFAFHMGSPAGAFRRAAAPEVRQRTAHIIAEDLMFGWDFFRKANTVFCVPETLYDYWQYPHSVSHANRSAKMILALMSMNIAFWNGAREYKGFRAVAKDVFNDLFRMMVGWHYTLVFKEVKPDETLENAYFDAFANFIKGPGSCAALGAMYPLALLAAKIRSRALLGLFVFASRQSSRVRFHLSRMFRNAAED